MENATIGYKGMSSVPSDYLCEDGDMKLAVDAEVRDGSYHATRVPKKECFHVDGFYPKFYHEPSDGKKYFIGLRHDGDKWVLSAYGKDGEKVEIENAPEAEEEGAFANFCAMGNLVCFTLDEKIVFIRYKEHYKYIDIPKKPIGIKFGAKLESYESDDASNKLKYKRTYKEIVKLSDIKIAELPEEYTNNEYYCPTIFSDDNLKADDIIFASLNSTIQSNLSECKFIFPVLLKYAVKLYSGEYVNISPPILLFPYRNNVYLQTGPNYYELYLTYDSYSIYYSITDEYKEYIKNLSELDGIVDTIDVFISKPICDIRTDHVVGYKLKIAWGDGIEDQYIYYPRFVKNNNFENIHEQINYYLIKSWKLNDLLNTNDYKDGSVFHPVLSINGEDNSKLQTLEQQQVLNVSTYSNTHLYTNGLITYNSRIISYNMFRPVAELWPIEYLCPPVLAKYDNVIELTESDNGEPTKYLRSYTYYNMNNSNISKIALSINSNVSVTNVIGYRNGSYLPIYFEFPMDGYGYFYFVIKNSAYRVNLNRSTYNSCSYFFYIDKDHMSSDITKIDIGNIPRENSKPEMYANLVKESNVNDPFTFKDGNSCECGKGSVMAVASMSSPTSQGQFGQYPLFAFCTDGIYAIGIGSDGTIQNCSPYSTDILAGEEALANVGRDIVFASKAGVMSIGEEGRSLLLPAIKEELYGYDNERQKTFVSKVLTDMEVPLPETTNVYTYITNGVRMAYDYQHGRVILYNPNYGYSYVLDAQSKSWSIMTKQFKDHLNPVAECLMVAPDGQTLHDYSTDEVVEKHGAFLMTRPFKMEAANVMKTIYSLIQRGNLRSKDAVQQALYGSRDLVNWMPIWSSKDIYLRGFRGTGYKYFRLLVFLPEMTQNDGIDGATISYLPRETDQQR